MEEKEMGRETGPAAIYSRVERSSHRNFIGKRASKIFGRGNGLIKTDYLRCLVDKLRKKMKGVYIFFVLLWKKKKL